MLSQRISFSKRVPLLTLKNQVIFTWIIPWLDDYGCFTADPEEINSQVLSKNKKITEKDIYQGLIEIAGLGLIKLYCKDDEWYQQYTNFEKFQTFKNDRPRISLYPQYKDRDEAKTSTGFQWFPVASQSKVKLSKVKRLSPNGDRDTVRASFGNEDVNKLLIAFKKKTGLSQLGEPDAKTRQYAWNLIRKYSMDQIKEGMDWLMEDTFWRDNLTKLSQLWYQMPRFLRETDTTIEEVKPK